MLLKEIQSYPTNKYTSFSKHRASQRKYISHIKSLDIEELCYGELGPLSYDAGYSNKNKSLISSKCPCTCTLCNMPVSLKIRRYSSLPSLSLGPDLLSHVCRQSRDVHYVRHVSALARRAGIVLQIWTSQINESDNILQVCSVCLLKFTNRKTRVGALLNT
jgi:hypothetical protein